MKGVFLANQKTNGKVVTLITYNKGRDWGHLRPPSTDMNGKPTNCEPVGASPIPTFPGAAQGGTSEKGHLRARGHRRLWTQQNGRVTGQSERQVRQSVRPQHCHVTNHLQQSCVLQIWAQPGTLLIWVGLVTNVGVCRFRRGSAPVSSCSPSTWDQRGLPVVAMAEVQEPLLHLQIHGPRGGPGSAPCLCVWWGDRGQRPGWATAPVF